MIQQTRAIGSPVAFFARSEPPRWHRLNVRFGSKADITEFASRLKRIGTAGGPAVPIHAAPESGLLLEADRQRDAMASNYACLNNAPAATRATDGTF
jgi:hypothetical protein